MLIDIELHELIFCALDLKIPVTIITQWFSNIMLPNVPPISSNIVPEEGFSGSRFGIKLAWIYSKYYVKRRILIDILKRQNGRRQILKKYAREVGLAEGSLIPSDFPPVFEYKYLKVWTLNLKQLDFPGSELPNITYIGAMVNENRNMVEEGASSSEIDKLLDNKKNRKLVYCSVSSMNSADVVFLKKVVKAFEAAPEWILIVSLGGKTEPEDFDTIPNNVHLFKWVPQIKVLKNSDISINHGGIHTINECIHFSIPMLVYSGGRYDQNGCSSRIRYHGLGIVGDKITDTPDIINQNIAKLINDERYSDAMRKMNIAYNEVKRREIAPLL